MTGRNNKNSSRAPLAGFLTLLLLSPMVSANDELWGDEGQLEEVAFEDPFESVNRGVYRFNEIFDDYLLEPAAQGYGTVTPEPVKKSIGNFFSNLSYPLVVVNDLLQGKFLQGGSDFARVMVNSTIGVFGLFDVATHLDMVKHDEDFGQTLASWGFDDGAYIVLPFLGPSNVRDTGGVVAELFTDPLLQIEGNGARNALVAVNAIDTRDRLAPLSDLVDESAIDPYAFVRSSYQQNRTRAIAE